MAENTGRKTERFRFHVYPNNKAVLKWISSQMNLSASLSQIIIDAIQTYGYRDIMANEVEDVDKVKRGRPPKQNLSAEEEAKTEVVKQDRPVETLQPTQKDMTPTARTVSSFFGD